MDTFAVVIQARTGSTRLPNKVLADICGEPMLKVMIDRIKISKKVDDIILATTEKLEDDVLEELAVSEGIKIIRGSSNDVLYRYICAMRVTKANNIIRVTGDCPLIDPNLIDEGIEKFKNHRVEYLSNCYPPTFPDGLDFEIFSTKLLREADKKCNDEAEREHVTPWMRQQKDIDTFTIMNDVDYSNYRWTVDEKEDLTLIREIVSQLKRIGKTKFDWKDIISLFDENPSLKQINNMYSRNEGMKINSGQKMWRRAKKVIPGGNMLLSKRPEMFLPNQWPSYYSKAKGCYVWDLDGKKYIDMSIMGIGTNILGYGRREVDDVVRKTIDNGNMSTLNCPEEVILAEKLISIHPWARMVKYARSGGEANAIAVRIARASTGKEVIAICGYHGWHDWYLASNIESTSELNEHLLQGLEPNGVPKSLKNTVKQFKYNDINKLREIVSEGNVAAVKMEVQRTIIPNIGFLEEVRAICDQNGIVLIFDECTSGFRETFGGLHLKYNVMPDMAMFGKALGNGYAITAVIGKECVMDAAQSTFISSTFWTERIGPSAAIKTLEIMEKEKSWNVITKAGKTIKEFWKHISEKYKVEINIYGLDALATFQFEGTMKSVYKTFLTQEMLKKGFLASTSCYLCQSHNDDIIESYKQSMEEVFFNIKSKDDEEIKELINGDICHTGFERLN